MFLPQKIVLWLVLYIFLFTSVMWCFGRFSRALFSHFNQRFDPLNNGKCLRFLSKVMYSESRSLRRKFCCETIGNECYRVAFLLKKVVFDECRHFSSHQVTLRYCSIFLLVIILWMIISISKQTNKFVVMYLQRPIIQ